MQLAGLSSSRRPAILTLLSKASHTDSPPPLAISLLPSAPLMHKVGGQLLDSFLVTPWSKVTEAGG